MQFPRVAPSRTEKWSRSSVWIGPAVRLLLSLAVVLGPAELPTGQIGNNDSADDVRDVDLTRIHYLTGPFEIETAEPGDVLLVEIQDVQPLQEQPWGFTGIFSKENGGGFLDEIYPKPCVASPSGLFDGCEIY